jgi:hypothetical protein
MVVVHAEDVETPATIVVKVEVGVREDIISTLTDAVDKEIGNVVMSGRAPGRLLM